MSAAATAWAWKTPTKSPTMKLILLVLAEFATEKNKTGVSMEGLQFMAGMTQANIEYALQNLAEDGRIIDTGKRIGDQQDIRVFQLMINQPIGKLKRRVKSKNQDIARCEEIYNLYPRPIDRPKSFAAIGKAIGKFGFDFVKERTILYAASWKGRTDMHLCPYAATFYNGERFNDNPTLWGTSAKPVSAGPKFNEVREYVLQHVGKDDRGWSASFYGYWNDPKRNWKTKEGQSIDWKERLSKQLAAWRASEQKTNLTPT